MKKMTALLLLATTLVVASEIKEPVNAKDVHKGVAIGCAFTAKQLNDVQKCGSCVSEAPVPKDEELVSYMTDLCISKFNEEEK
jgi:hypothetical protein